MNKKTKGHAKDRMIHIRLDEQIHRQLRILVAKKDTTIQQLVSDLIRCEITESGKRKT